MKAHYGIRSEKLVEFGVQPFRGRKVKPVEATPATSQPPVSTPQAPASSPAHPTATPAQATAPAAVTTTQ
ncbi:MAG TPA: hypothetical protein VIA62_05095 [Thermoanaerobaculia bacterium]|nr:hypothetical protein [Thermoanaerobaculia bacterium]